MANVKITDLTAYTDPLNTDVLAIVDVTNNVTKKVSIANMAKNVSLGTAALPGVAFDGDPNTGIYSPGADQLAISTNGTGRITVDASGNVNIDSNTLYVDAVNNRVGIGTTSNRNSTKLDVLGDITFGENANYYGTLGYNAGTGHAEYTSSDGGFKWIRRSGSATSMVLDSSGRLLVGTPNARTIEPYGLGADGQTAHTYESVGDSTPGPGIALGSSSTTDRFGPYLYLFRSRGGSVGSNTIVSSGDNLGTISFAGANGTDVRTRGAAIHCEVDGTPGANDMPGRLVFSTTADGSASPTERMRITSTGSILSFAASANDAITAGVASSAGATPYLFAGVHSRTGTAAGGTLSYSVAANGNVQNTNGSYTTISDAKLKENIVDAGSQWDDFKVIRICNWNYKAETGHQTHRQIGPIANELEAVCPGLVFETPDRDEDGNETGEVTKGVNQSVLYMKAVKALQEAMERIETLEVSNADMLARVTALEAA